MTSAEQAEKDLQIRGAREIEMIAVGKLKPFKKNPRTHDENQVLQLARSIEAYGFTNPVLIDEKNGIIAGHGRLLAAQRLGIKEIPCVRLPYLTPDEKKAYVIADNKLALNAGWHPEYLPQQLDELLAAGYDMALTGFDTEELKALTEAAASPEDDDQDGAQPDQDDEPPLDEDKDKIYELREDAVFSSSNWLGFPDLRRDMLADVVPNKIFVGHDKAFEYLIPADGDYSNYLGMYHHIRKEQSYPGLVCGFYIADEKFESLWSDAVKVGERLARQQLAAVLTPDFSLFDNDPTIVSMYNVYRSRWCARYWQELGLKVIPHMQWSDDKSFDWALLGIPKNPPVIAFQCRTNRYGGKAMTPAQRDAFWKPGIERFVAELQPESVLVYGGHENRSWIEPLLPDGPDWHFLPSATLVRTKLKRGESV